MAVVEAVLSDGHSFSSIRRIRYELPASPILMIGIYTEEMVGVKARRAGATEYLCSYGNPPSVFVATLRRLAPNPVTYPH